MMIRITATPTTTAASFATLRPGAFIAHGDSASLFREVANARNSAVLAEISGLARNSPVLVGMSVLAGGCTSRSDMAKTVADEDIGNRPDSGVPVETAPAGALARLVT